MSSLSSLKAAQSAASPKQAREGIRFFPPALDAGKKKDYETFIRNEFRRFFSCKPGQPCTATMSLSQLGAWLRFNPYRPKERLGLPNLNFDDFMGFKSAFHNAIGRYFEDWEYKFKDRTGKEMAIKFDYPSRGFTFPDDNDLVLVADPKSNETSLAPARTEVLIDGPKGYAEDVYAMMNKSGAGVDIDEFTAHMLKYYS